MPNAMKYIRVTTLNSIYVLEENDLGDRRVVEIQTNDGILKPVHLSILNEGRDMLLYNPKIGFPMWGGHKFNANGLGGFGRLWQSSTVTGLGDIEYGSRN